MLITLHKGLFVSNYPNYIRNMFTFRSSKYNLSGNNISDLPKRNTTTYGLHSFTYLTAKLWNSLPINPLPPDGFSAHPPPKYLALLRH